MEPREWGHDTISGRKPKIQALQRLCNGNLKLAGGRK